MDYEALWRQSGGQGDRPVGWFGPGGSATSGGGGFDFDYVAEAQKAYGELGVYYARILEWSQGDMNKAISRLTQDYERGLRVKRENFATAQAGAELQRGYSLEAAKQNALARGIYQRSLFDPAGGLGLGGENQRRVNETYNINEQERQRNLSRYEEEAGIQKERGITDLTEAQKRREFELEQERRTKSAELANTRAQAAYQKYQYSNLFNPGLV